MAEVNDVKEISIKQFLEKRGIAFSKEGPNFICRSPLSMDRTPSFYYYPRTNTFYDWANGVGGDILTLVQEMENIGFKSAIDYLAGESFPKIEQVEYEEPIKEEFILDKYISNIDWQINKIREYALYRGIVDGYVPSRFAIRDGDGFKRRFGVGFVHTDYSGDVVGLKIRDIEPYNGRRFTLRGTQMFYVLENIYDHDQDCKVYLVESETSANSLWMFMRAIKQQAIVISFGSWNNVPLRVPDKYSDFSDVSFIIDYDGNEELYNNRVVRFNHLNAKEIKLELEKGKDLNSLYKTCEIFKYKQLIL
jgi:hypothetical protein